MKKPTNLFLSYSRKPQDLEIVEGVIRPILDDLGVKVKIDSKVIRTGDVLPDVIKFAIDSADSVLLVASSNSIVSPWCMKECLYARRISKPVLPFLIEYIPESRYPFELQDILYTSLQKVPQDNWINAIANVLHSHGYTIDFSLLPDESSPPDLFGCSIYPDYLNLRISRKQDLLSYISECRKSLQINPQSGYHYMNLALLLLYEGDISGARAAIRNAIQFLPDTPEVFYYGAMIAIAAEPLVSTNHTRLKQIEDLIETADNKGADKGLTLRLKAIIAKEYYARNGMRSPYGSAANLMEYADNSSVPNAELLRFDELFINAISQ